MNTQSEYHISEQEYLTTYAQAIDKKYEYINGEVWAMAGSSRNHNLIAGNCFAELRQHLKGVPCKPFMSDWRVKCEHNYYYPDVVVDCDSLRDKNQAGQPIVIIEVLSDSTRETDLTFKLQDYKKIPTLQEYILVEQNFMAVTVYRRVDNWKAETYSQSTDLIELASLNYQISVAEMYADVVFPTKTLRLLKSYSGI